jgi:hypothetical protein
MKSINPKERLSFQLSEKSKNTKHTTAGNGYNSTMEAIYTADHPEVVAFTGYFEKRVRKLRIFERFNERFGDASKERASVVGVLWHRFSEFMPWFLCQAAADVSNNELRHYVIQTPFEELGMRDVSQIHPDMFWRAAQLAGVTEEDRRRFRNTDASSLPLHYLSDKLSRCRSDSEILGMLLGLEIPAIENIETVFSSLAYTKPLRENLAEDKFFRLHRQIEIEHVRLTVANFLRFCGTLSSKKEFLRGFDSATHFWELFWSNAGALIENVARKGTANE